jgi:hypothetical protein
MLPFLIVGAAALYALSKKSDNEVKAAPMSKPESAVRRNTSNDFSEDEEFYSGSDYISDCAEEWGMSEDDVANQLGLDKD